MQSSPGKIRDAILDYLQSCPHSASLAEIHNGVASRIRGAPPASSVRSYLRLNTPKIFCRTGRGHYKLVHNSSDNNDGDGGLPKSLFDTSNTPPMKPAFKVGRTKLYYANCIDWLRRQPECSVHAVITDPPFGLVEYSSDQQEKLRSGHGGIWRIPPSFDGSKRSPLPRFTVLNASDLARLNEFYTNWAKALIPALVPGANVIVASNPLLSHVVSNSLVSAGLERRGEIVRLVMTMRGGDRPKNAHTEFPDVSVMPRSMWEPWLTFRKPLDGRVQDNLRKWGTGGFRRPSHDKPFGDVVRSAPTRKTERQLAPHPSLKPQAFLRLIARGVLPLGKGVVLDPFAGSGSTLAACEHVGYESVGVESDEKFIAMAKQSIPRLSQFDPSR